MSVSQPREEARVVTALSGPRRRQRATGGRRRTTAWALHRHHRERQRVVDRHRCTAASRSSSGGCGHLNGRQRGIRQHRRKWHNTVGDRQSRRSACGRCAAERCTRSCGSGRSLSLGLRLMSHSRCSHLELFLMLLEIRCEVSCHRRGTRRR